MSWTVEEIEREWLGGERLGLPPDDVLRAFEAAERVRGREWVRSTTYLPGGGRMWGFGALWPVLWFGTRMKAIAGARGIEAFTRRLERNDPAAESELTSIHILRGQQLRRELEVEPQVVVGGRNRVPDFRIRDEAGPWTYVEVTGLRSSSASEEAQRLLSCIADAVISVKKPFMLETVLRRGLTEEEEQELIQEALGACQLEEGSTKEVGDFAWVLVKTGHPALIVPSPIPNDGIPRMAVAKGIGGSNEANRQVIVRVPFADERAEDILAREARQLPREEPGLIMVDVGGQPTAFESWPAMIPPRFTGSQHTRVGGVLLFMTAITPTSDGLTGLTYPKLIPNPHTRNALPSWITDLVKKSRADIQDATGQPDRGT